MFVDGSLTLTEVASPLAEVLCEVVPLIEFNALLLAFPHLQRTFERCQQFAGSCSDVDRHGRSKVAE